MNSIGLDTEAKFYLQKALSCVQKISDDCEEKPIILCKVARYMKSIDAEKASELAQQILVKSISTYTPWNCAKVIHLLSGEYEKSCQTFIELLQDSREARKALSIYLKEYGKENVTLTQQCIEKMTSWGHELNKVNKPKSPEKEKQEIDYSKTDRKSVGVCLSNLASQAKSHPEATRKVLPTVVAMVEGLPDYEDLPWKPGMGKKRDARISYIDDKIYKILALIEIYLEVGAFEEALLLKKHRLLNLEQNPAIHLKYKLMEAEYFRSRDPLQAEKLYSEAWVIAKNVNAYDWDYDDIRKRIAVPMIDLNPLKAFEIAKTMNGIFAKSGTLLKCVKVISTTNRPLAKKCLEEMSDEKCVAAIKAKAYLKCVKA